MNDIQEYANFLLKIGHKVSVLNNTYWYDSQPNVYQSFPFHYLIEPDNIDTSKIFCNGGFIARFPCPIEKGRDSYRISITDTDYDLSSLNGKTRNQTRRGLENCELRELTTQEVLNNAMTLNTDTLERQGRTLSAKEKNYWETYYKEINSLNTASIWGAFVQNELASFLISVHMDGCENILIVRSKREMLKYYPNNAMIYQFVSTMIRKNNVNEVSIGLESIQSDMESLDRFKMGMGFNKTPIGQRVVFRSPFSFLISGWRANMICKALPFLLPKGEKLNKIQGLLTWYGDQK